VSSDIEMTGLMFYVLDSNTGELSHAVYVMAFFSSLVWDCCVEWLMRAKNQCWSFYWNLRKVLLVVTKCYSNFGVQRGNWLDRDFDVSDAPSRRRDLRIRQGSITWKFKKTDVNIDKVGEMKWSDNQLDVEKNGTGANILWGWSCEKSWMWQNSW
jgi:hypothetical protein